MAGNAKNAPTGIGHERGEEDRPDAAVRAAEPRVRDRADARERERRERDLPGPTRQRDERQRDERGAHARA